MTDNMTDITLKKEKIKDLRDKYLEYQRLLDEWPKRLIPIEKVKPLFNDLVEPLFTQLSENCVNTSLDSSHINGETNTIELTSDTDCESHKTKTSIDNIDRITTDLNDTPIVSLNISHNKIEDNLTKNSEISDKTETEVLNSLSNNCSENIEIESIYLNKSEDKVCVNDKDIETGANDSYNIQTSNHLNRISSEISSEESDDKNSNNSMSGSIRTRLRKKCDKSEAQKSDSSEINFTDSSDIPETDSDSDYHLRSSKGLNKQRDSKYEKLLKDFRLKFDLNVNLIKLDDDIIYSALDDCGNTINVVNDLEKQLFLDLAAKGVVCRQIKPLKQKSIKTKKDTEKDSNSDSEVRRLCRLPKMRRSVTNGDKRVNNHSNDSNSDNGKEKKQKKLKTSTPLKNHNIDEDLDSDCDLSTIANNSKFKANKMDIEKTKVNALDSDVSTDEELNKKTERTKSRPKRNLKKAVNSDSDNNTNGLEEKLNDLKKSNKEDNDKTVIDVESDEDIVPKRKVIKRRVSDDEDYDDNDSKESSDGMDPSADSDSASASASASDSDSDSDLDSDSKPKKKKSKSKSKGKRKRVKVHNSSDDDDCKVLSDENDSPNKSRKNIRKIISDKKIDDKTKDAAVAERERVKRIQDKQKEYNDLIKTRSLKSADIKELILEFDKETKEPLVEVDPILVKFLKPHQKEGIEFMYNCVVETIEQLSTSSGSGCILAHSMGLGKTLQVITFLYTILTNKEIADHIKRALVICPVNTIKNWANEFRVWLNDNDLDDLLVFEMSDAKTPLQRADLLNIWHKRGGVMIIGLTLFSSLVMGGRGKKPSKSVRDAIQKCLLDPGPEVVICDEGHLLKNEKTAYNKAVSQIKSIRRVVLTGTPLQNNLNEYHVMVHFVKPNLLGNRKEFTNRFVNPINNGQHEDSTDYDVKIMKKRVHILHTLLNGCVHRCDYNVLVPYLQPKYEFVISVMLTEKQIELYSFYLQNRTDKQKLSLLADYGSLRLIWNHPILLYEQHRRRVEKENQESIDDFIDDDEDADTPVSDSDIECIDGNAGPSQPIPKRRMKTRFGNNEEEAEEELELKSEASDEAVSDAWFSQMLKKDEAKHIELSGKFILLFAILEECEKLGDKILLFSQSLDTLDLVEEMLKIRMERAAEESQKIQEIDLETGYLSDATNKWYKNRDYFRLDGSTASEYRKAYTDHFNDEKNYRARLFLISTKAGGLGINLVGANRCIIFDASWNPTHDVQAIFRIFRFGQKKPVYVYRFVAQGTMEEKIYERQIIKQSLSCRVVDEQSIQRHFKAGEVSELYAFTPDKRKDRPIPKLPKDRLLAELLKSQKEFIVGYHEHDSLLENRPEEDMTEEEKAAAWNEYEQEKDALFIREQQEREAHFQRQYLMAQAAQQQQQQQQQYLQQQQFAQQFAQMSAQQLTQRIYQMQSQNSGNTNMNYQHLISNMYQQIMREGAEQRRQQQQRLQEVRQQQMAQINSNSGGGLPGYDRMTIEDIVQYLKGLNTNISNSDLINRIFGIIETGLNTCNKELQNAKLALTTNNTPEMRNKYEKVAKEVFNLNTQKKRAETVFKNSLMFGGVPNILRQPNQPMVEDIIDEDLEPSTSATKSTDQLIEEVD